MKHQINSELYDFLTATDAHCSKTGIFPDKLICKLYNKHGVCIHQMFTDKKGTMTVIDDYNNMRDYMLKMWYKNQEPKNLSGKEIIVSMDGKDYKAIIK